QLEANQLPEKLKKAGAAHWLHATLCVNAPSAQGRGMHGSGMFIINPPWTLNAALKETLPYLAQTLALDNHAAWQVDECELDQKKSSPD
ncbi:MAG TPA: 23S rRNA (adenine(2030)-N(6))-methyltransferase RlmJ, partial [Rugosibacter sp.]|nr:23S rRNA (adenine(2030)-N(6))-methyltransferase RlmJ [Rugosibacter sp.]